jgi:hypothetical protein
MPTTYSVLFLRWFLPLLTENENGEFNFVEARRLASEDMADFFPGSVIL